MKKILVIGSSNVDYTYEVDDFPVVGETILSKSMSFSIGGKGLNQAVAISLSGADVSFLTALGNDKDKEYILKELSSYNIKIYPLIKEEPTGSAFILVNNKGENKIVVHGGANLLLSKQDIDEHMSLLEECDYVLMQLEIPPEVVRYIIHKAKELNKIVIVNPAPIEKSVNNLDIFKFIDYLTPNENEAKILANISSNDYRENAKKLLSYGVKNVIITLGDKGSYILNKDIEKHIETPKVTSIDSTGAGDCYNGFFVGLLSKGYSLEESLDVASKMSAISVTRKGAAKSYPKYIK